MPTFLLPQKLSLRHPRCHLSATLRSSSEQPFDFTMHYIGHRESTYVMVNVTHLSTTSIEYYYVSEKVAFGSRR